MPGLIRGQPRSSAFPAGMFSEQTSLNDYRELCSLSFNAFRFNNTPHSRVSGPRVLRAKLFLLFVFYEETCFALFGCSGYISSCCRWTKVKNYPTGASAER